MSSLRREIRILVLQTLFEIDSRDVFSDVKGALQVYKRIALENTPELVDNPFAKKVIEGLLSKKDDIDNVIERVAENYSIDRVAIVDRNILRLGIFELLFGKSLDVPGRVAINEAIELAKVFGSDNSGKFINGVLGTIYKELGPEKDERVEKKTRKYVGAIVFLEDEEPRFAFVNDVFGKWTLSKGGIENEENEEEGLIRVIKDELGILVRPIKRIGKNTYLSHPPEGPLRKEVTYFLAKAEDSKLNLKESGGLKAASWYKLEDAKSLPMYKDVKNIILENMEMVVEKMKSNPKELYETNVL